jgi:hypothetical protein
MSKVKAKKVSSPFDALRIARRPLGRSGEEDKAVIPGPEAIQTASQLDIQTSKHLDIGVFEQPDVQTSKQSDPLAKSKDPAYVKFTTYIDRDIHLRVKALAVRHQLEMSQLVEELLVGWLKRYPE